MRGLASGVYSALAGLVLLVRQRENHTRHKEAERGNLVESADFAGNYTTAAAAQEAVDGTAGC